MNDALRRQIFAACRELGLDSDARRDLQKSVTGKSSLTEMSAPELQLVVNRLKEAGTGKQTRRKGYKPAPRPDLRLVHVLWSKLGQAGQLNDPTRAGLNAFIRKRFSETWGAVPADVDQLRDAEQIDAVLQALMSWGRRANIDFDWQRIGKR
ncbi:MAG: regulatory protein GemA [Pelagimonas sp.]|jgi:phage gp16-like protein|nr:regulatory protein GemA [Pelagimonas sp.]